MVSNEVKKEAQLVSEAALELKGHVDNILRDVRVDLGTKDLPARRAAALFAPVDTNGGQYVTFAVYKRALKEMAAGVDRVFGIPFNMDAVADVENNSFKMSVEKMEEEGKSTGEAMGIASGLGNIDSLAEGMIMGLIKMLEGIIPNIDSLGSSAVPLGDYMSIGMPTTELQSDLLVTTYATTDAVFRASSYLKASAGIQDSADKEKESAPARLVKYTIATAIKNINGDYSPSHRWQAWAMYPELRTIVEESRELANSEVSDRKPSISYLQGGQTVDSNTSAMRRLTSMRQDLRKMAIMLHSCPSKSDVCCVIGALTQNILQAKNLIRSLRSVLSAGMALNLVATFSIPDIAPFINRIKTDILMRVVRAFDAIYFEMVKGLKEQFRQMEGNRCLSLDLLFDVCVRILSDLRAVVVKKLKEFAASIELESLGYQIKINQVLDASVYAEYDFILNLIEVRLDSILKCNLDEAGTTTKLIQIAEEFECGSVPFTFHVRGEELPEGIDPDYPLLNLDPISLGNYELAPGIRGLDLPTDSFDELLKVTQAGKLSQYAPAQIKRR